MRKWILFTLTALVLAACAAASTDAPPLPTVAPTLPPDLTQTAISQQTGTLPEATDPPTLVPPTPISQPNADSGTTTGLLMTLPPPTFEVPPNVTVTGDAVIIEATSAIQEALGQLPPPGTAIVPATEEANPLDAVSPFDNIYYVETGGPTNSTLEIEIYSDGRVIRNGTETRISAAAVEELNLLIRDSRFFSLIGQFTQPGGASTDSYTYSARVELETGASRRIEAHDRLTPPELLRLFTRLRMVGL
jgi:hypothetical protein